MLLIIIVGVGIQWILLEIFITLILVKNGPHFKN